MKKGFFVLASVLAAAAIYVAYTQVSVDVYKVKVDAMKTGDIKISLDLTGVVRPRNQSELLTTGGVISDVYVNEGDTVNSGQALFAYDTSDIEKQLDSAKQELEALEEEQSKQQTQSAYGDAGGTMSQYAQNAVSLAQSSGYELYHYNNEITNKLAKGITDRLLAAVGGDIQSLIQSYLPQIQSALSSDTVLPQITDSEELLKNVDKNASLGVQIKTAKENVESLEEKLASMKVSSQISGKVLEVGVKKGETVAANSTAVVVADTDDMEVYSNVSSKDVKSIRNGMNVDIYSVDGKKKYPGEVTRIGQEIRSDSTGSENMTDLVISPKYVLDELPGSSIDLEVVLNQKKGVNIIPLDCLTADGSVFVLDAQNRVYKRAVQKGLQDDYNVEIKGGLQVGEKLVLNPDKDLKEGQKVSIVD